LAKNPISEMTIGDRICMRKWSPIKEGTVVMFDEEEANILFDDGTKEWIHLGYFYITRKDREITMADGKPWREFKTERGS
jgi:hypothetical protein